MFEKLTFTKIVNGIVIPFKLIDDQNHIYEGGMYNNQGNLIKSSIRDYASKCLFKYNMERQHIDVKDLDNVSSKSVFIGHITNHYGHFLLETMSRFWIFLFNYLDKFQIKNIVFIKWIDESNNNKYKLFEIISNMINLQKYNIIFVDKPTKFNTIFIPQKLCYINKKMLNDQKIIYNELVRNSYCSSNNKVYKKIYISRLKGIKRIKNENDIINIFKKYNFYIVNPQVKNFRYDILLYKQATVIAGLDGSNLHNVVFAKNKTNLIHISSGRELLANQVECNKLKSINMYFIPYYEIIDKKNYFDINFLEKQLLLYLNIIKNK